MRTKGMIRKLIIGAIYMIALIMLIAHNNIMIALLVCTWISLIAVCLKDFERHVVFFSFLSTFFLFLIGQELFVCYGWRIAPYKFSQQIDFHAQLLLFVSLLFLGIGYFVFPHFRIKARKRRPTKKNYSSNYYRFISQSSKQIFYLTFALSIYKVSDTINFVIKYGYLAYYTSYSSQVPFIIRQLGEVSPIAFWVYLSTMPKKRECRMPILLFLVYSLITLGRGSRGTFAANVLVLFIYFVMRNNINSNGEDWFDRKKKIICISLVPMICLLMLAVNSIRSGRQVEQFSLVDGIAQFIYQQGVSINVIKFAERYKTAFSNSKMYMIGSTIEYILNIMQRLMFGNTPFLGNNLEHALKGYSLAHTLSYVALKQRYLAGNGLGSCYIAEVYQDLGYIGVVLINLILGCIISKIGQLRNKGIWSCSVIFCLLQALVLMPRASTDNMLLTLINIRMWATFLAISFYAKILSLKYSH